MYCYRATLRDIRNGFEAIAFRNHSSNDLALYCWTHGLCASNAYRTRMLYPGDDCMIVESGSGLIELIEFKNITTGEVLLNESLRIYR